MTLSRTLILAAVAAGLALPSPLRAAEDVTPEHLAEDVEAALYFLCRDYGTIAATIMRIRQQETPRAVAMSTVRRAVDGEQLRRDAQAMVAAAYERPKYDTPPYIEGVVARFRDGWIGHCYDRWTPVAESIVATATGTLPRFGPAPQ